MISFESKGDFLSTMRFLRKNSKVDLVPILRGLAKRGVAALSAATPSESGRTAGSWGYEIVSTRGSSTITWTNSHIVDGIPIAIILQYGHGTGTGGYVSGRDYINPAIAPIFDQISNEAWKAVTSA